MTKALLTDRFVQITCIAFAVLIGFYADPVIAVEQRVFFALQVAPLAMLGWSLAAALRPLRTSSSPAEKRFWALLAAGLVAWWLSQLMFTFVPPEHQGTGTLLWVDGLQLGSFLLLTLVLSQRPHLPAAASSKGNGLSPSFARIAIVTILLGGAAYFVVIPARYAPEEYRGAVPSLLLFILLDTLLVAGFLLRMAQAQGRWRSIYGLLAAAATLWWAADVLDGLVFAEALWLPVGTAWDLPFYLFPVAITVASAVAVGQPADPPEPVPFPTARETSVSWSVLPLLLAGVIPLLHFGLYALGGLDGEIRAAREGVVVTVLVLLLLTALVQSLLLRGRNRELESAFTVLISNEQLQQAQRMEALGRLTSGIAHDFNNLLLVIRGSAEMLTGSVPHARLTGQEGTRILDATRRAEGLIEQLMAFGRQRPPQPERLLLGRELDQLEPLLQRLIGEDVELTIDATREDLCVRIDRNQLAQVVLNLAINARAAMPGGGSLELYLQRTLVDVGEDAPAPGEYAELVVRDSGHGMDDATRRRAIEPSFTTKEGGSGLGLATTRGIVHELGGAMRLTSEPGRGTDVRILLPLLETIPATDEIPRPEPIAPTAPVPSRPGGETILVVEDEAEVRELTRQWLAASGYRVLVAANASEAQRVLSEDANTPDLLVVDMVLPDLNGIELARSLNLPRMPVVLTSGYSADSLNDRGLSSTGCAFLQKPYALEDLERLVGEELEAAQAAASAEGA
ncbi:MAG: ATP-binding protein [Planctomycetota bacterium]